MKMLVAVDVDGTLLDTEFDDVMGAHRKAGAHQIDAVFHHDIAQHHGNRIAPCHQQEHAGDQ